MTPGIIEINLHGLTMYQTKVLVDSQLKHAKGDVYRLRLIHGYQRGTTLREFVRNTYKKHPKVLRIELGLNEGQTDLVLRELI